MSMAVMFDKLKYVQRLKSGGVPEEQARAGAEALTDALEEWGTGVLASRADLHETRDSLRLELQGFRSEFKGDIASLRTELKGDIAGLRTEFKGEIAGLRTEFKGEIAGLRTELKGDIAGLRNEALETKVELKDEINYVRLELADIRSEFKLMKWMMAFLMAGMGTVLTKLFL